MFTQQQGNGDLAFLEKLLGTYIKDDWQALPGLSLSFGLRYDWQNYFHDNNNVAPRFSLAYAPGNKKTNVLRVGIGVFNDRSGPVVIADVLHSQPGGLIKYVITDPGYPDPFASTSVAASQPPSIVRLAPDVQIPQTLQYSGGLDHQLHEVADALAHLHRDARAITCSGRATSTRRRRRSTSRGPIRRTAPCARWSRPDVRRPTRCRSPSAARCRAGSTGRCSTR